MTGVHGEPNIRAYAEKMANFGDVTEPDQKTYEIYREVGEIQAKIYPALKEINNEIQEFVERHPDSRLKKES